MKQMKPFVLVFFVFLVELVLIFTMYSAYRNTFISRMNEDIKFLAFTPNLDEKFLTGRM